MLRLLSQCCLLPRLLPLVPITCSVNLHTHIAQFNQPQSFPAAHCNLLRSNFTASHAYVHHVHGREHLQLQLLIMTWPWTSPIRESDPSSGRVARSPRAAARSEVRTNSTARFDHDGRSTHSAGDAEHIQCPSEAHSGEKMRARDRGLERRGNDRSKLLEQRPHSNKQDRT
jgi:hypothetical protein